MRTRRRGEEATGDEEIEEPGEREQDRVEEILDEEQARHRQIGALVDAFQFGRLEFQIEVGPVLQTID